MAKDKTPKIVALEIDLGGKTVSLTPEQARELHTQLGALYRYPWHPWSSNTWTISGSSADDRPVATYTSDTLSMRATMAGGENG